MADFEFLPLEVRPLHYQLCLRPRLDDDSFRFQGWLVVHLDVVSNVSKIVCNALDLDIKSVRIDSLDNEPIDQKCIEIDNHKETLTIRLSRHLEVGRTKLFIDFEGSLNDKMKGFYRSSFEHGGARHWMASTQFEATSARLCFPCWDEPSLKATFSVSIISRSKYTALTNMPEQMDTQDCDDLRGMLDNYHLRMDEKLSFFQTTPLMSTYLLAVVVGELEWVQGFTKDNIEVRVFAPLGQGDKCEFGLDVTIKSLEFYTDFFGIGCPLPKVDSVAIPDFLFGAMENWGLVTYRESALLIDPTHSSKASKQNVALIIAHEIAHHWFGNLVTMKWWTDLWLNEGFASFMMYLATDHILPQYQVWLPYVANTVVHALQADGLASSHPIEVPVHHPNQIEQIFDAISYQKGSTVIRMLYTWIGESAFRSGMKSYLEKFSFSNATTADLWQSLAEASNKPVDSVMSTWTKQMGFPLLKIEQKSSKSFSLEQEKFAYLPLSTEKERKAMWQIPIVLETDTKSQQTLLMTQKKVEFEVDDDKFDFIKLNSGFFGYYRVLYPHSMLGKLADNAFKFGEADRLNLINDIFALVKSGHMSAISAMETAMVFSKEEKSLPVWSAIHGFVNDLSQIVEEEDDHRFDMFAQKLFSNVFADLGFDAKENEDHSTALLRPRIIAALAEAGQLEVLEEAQTRFEAEDISPNIKDAVYIAVVIKNSSRVENFFELYKAAKSSEEKNRLARAMVHVKDEQSSNKVLEFALSSHVRNQDAPMIIAGMKKRVGMRLAWNFVQKNIDDFKAKFGTNNLMGRMLGLPASGMVATRDEVKDFFVQQGLNESMKMTTDKILEQIDIVEAWKARDAKQVAHFLKSFHA